MSNLCKKDRELYLTVHKIMFDLAQANDLKLHSVRPLEKRKCEWYFGRCSKRGNIRLRLRDVRNGKWAERDEVYQIVDTMAHELAHLYSQQHGIGWFRAHAHLLQQMASSLPPKDSCSPAGVSIYERLAALC